MKLQVATGDPLSRKGALVVLGVPEKEKPSELEKRADGLAGGLLKRIRSSGAFRGEVGSTYHAPLVGKGPAGILLVGLGKISELDLEGLRALGGRIVKTMPKVGAAEAALAAPPFSAQGGDGAVAQALAEGILLAEYSFDRLKSKKKEDEKKPKAEKIVIFAPEEGVSAARRGAARAEKIAAAAALARDLVSLPANVATPSYVARRASGLAKAKGAGKNPVACRVLGRAAIEKEKMGSFLSVSRGSVEEPKLVVLQYKGGGPKGKNVVLVGKGITFDSGGLSLKPSSAMDDMKIDMSGAAAVIGAVKAAADLGLKVNVVGLTPLCENMPSGAATRPGDVVTSRSGKTIEILNTDAEGRLILADALDYAKKFKPDALVDLATLTGACMVALGLRCAGLFTRDDELAEKLTEAGERSGERVWRLPLWKEYREDMKSDIADIKNIGNRWCGAITAAAFLGEFVDDEVSWAHLDIAGTATAEKGTAYIAKGASGFGVRLLVEFLKEYES